jgi:hypothetical protein
MTLKDVLSETWLSKQIRFDDTCQVAGIHANDDLLRLDIADNVQVYQGPSLVA